MFERLLSLNGKQFNFPRDYCRECDEVIDLLTHVEETGHLSYGKKHERVFNLPDLSQNEFKQELNEFKQELDVCKDILQSKELEIEGLKRTITKLTQALDDKPKNQPDS